MGVATGQAIDRVNQFKYWEYMQGAVVVKSYTEDVFVKQYNTAAAAGSLELGKASSLVPGGDKHLEETLFERLRKHYGGDFSRIPNKAGIVFYIPWSPCRNCTYVLIPKIATALDLANRDLVVKFRYDTVYTAENWRKAIKKGRKNFKINDDLWLGERVAKDAYHDLAISSGWAASYHHEPDEGEKGKGTTDGRGKVEEVQKRKLQILQMGWGYGYRT